MEVELQIAIFTGVFAGIGLLMRLSVQVGKFIQRVEFLEVRQTAQDDLLAKVDDRMDIIESKLPLMIVQGNKK